MEDRPDLHGPAALEAWDLRLAAADDDLAEAQLEFWTNICLCHSLIVEPNAAGGLPVYQVGSQPAAFGNPLFWYCTPLCTLSWLAAWKIMRRCRLQPGCDDVARLVGFSM